MSIFITAEIGINHNGDLTIAKNLIDMAKDCGCDAVKFQKRTIDKVYTPEFLDSPRQSPWGTTQREQKEGLEFGKAEYDIIDSYCRKVGIEWYASAWDIDSQIFLDSYNLKYNKVASAMITHTDLLYSIAEQRKLTYIATGKEEGVEQSVKIFKGYDCPFVLMHCVMKYPCPDNLCNLKAILELKEKYGGRVGYSSHNPSILPTSLAVVLGAEALEVHITLDRTMYGSDQASSFEKAGLEYIVRDARRVKEIVG